MQIKQKLHALIYFWHYGFMLSIIYVIVYQGVVNGLPCYHFMKNSPRMFALMISRTSSKVVHVESNTTSPGFVKELLCQHSGDHILYSDIIFVPKVCLGDFVVIISRSSFIQGQNLGHWLKLR